MNKKCVGKGAAQLIFQVKIIHFPSSFGVVLLFRFFLSLVWLQVGPIPSCGTPLAAVSTQPKFSSV